MLQFYDYVQNPFAYALNTYANLGAFFMSENAKNEMKKIVLPDELQKEILKFFMKTSIPRIAREKRERNEQRNSQKYDALSETKGQEIK